jgi:hypothetical protein
MSSGIFISYRRADSRHAAGRLADELAEAFGEENIFRDIEGIEIGVNFEQALERALGACVVMLVIIGPNWLDAKNEQGQRRLELEGDWTRQEIATALRRGIPVVPVLLEGTRLPRADQLPHDLRELSSRQQYELSDTRWRGDVQGMIDKLARIKGLQRTGPRRAAPRPSTITPTALPVAKPKTHWGWWVTAGVAVFISAIWTEFDSGEGGAVAFNPTLGAAQMSPQVPITQQPMPQVEPVVNTVPHESAAATLPRLAGLWRTSSGETYHFQQDGTDVRFTAEANGQNIGNGRGELEGNLLRLQMVMQLNGVALGNLNCNMQGAPDMRSFTGLCAGPNGQFPAQIFR